MATQRLFRLKAEVASSPLGPLAKDLPYAQIRVDTGVFHLDQLFDYLIPEKFSSIARTGVRVQLPFGGRETEGIIVDRIETPERAGELKSITKVLSSIPIATEQSLELIDEVAAHYACNPWDVIRSAIPPRVASVEKQLLHINAGVEKRHKESLSFQTLKPFIHTHMQVANLVGAHQDAGSVLVVAPDEKDVDLIIQALNDQNIVALKLTAAMSRGDRYHNFIQSMNPGDHVVVGTRSAVFAPVFNLATIIVHKESSVDHYEVRSPGWNSRVVSIMRAKSEHLNVVMTGFSPSIEVAQRIDQGSIKYLNTKEVVKVKAFTPADGSLLPGRIYSEIKKALLLGPVLFIAPRKGYGNALLCSHCRNFAMCNCGGRLSVSAKGLAPTCVHCGEAFASWKCSFCNRDKQYLASRGIDRAAEEISRAFPNFPVIISAGEVIKDFIDAKPSLVLATPGSQPLTTGGYAAVVILDGMRFFGHTDLRSQERARELFFESSSLISQTGLVLLVIDEVHPIVSAITRWNVAPLIKRELAERSELQLPPSVSTTLLVMDLSIGVQIANGLKKAISDDRLPQSTRVYGPTDIGKGQVKIVVHSAQQDEQRLTRVMHELQRRRSIAKKELFTIRVNPYSL